MSFVVCEEEGSTSQKEEMKERQRSLETADRNFLVKVNQRNSLKLWQKVWNCTWNSLRDAANDSHARPGVTEATLASTIKVLLGAE